MRSLATHFKNHWARERWGYVRSYSTVGNHNTCHAEKSFMNTSAKCYFMPLTCRFEYNSWTYGTVVSTAASGASWSAPCLCAGVFLELKTCPSCLRTCSRPDLIKKKIWPNFSLCWKSTQKHKAMNQILPLNSEYFFGLIRLQTEESSAEIVT